MDLKYEDKKPVSKMRRVTNVVALLSVGCLLGAIIGLGTAFVVGSYYKSVDVSGGYRSAFYVFIASLIFAAISGLLHLSIGRKE